MTLAEEVNEREDEWGHDTQLLVGIFEMLQLIRIEQLVGIGVKRHNLPTFNPVPRPGEKPDAGPKTVTPREAAALVMGV